MNEFEERARHEALSRATVMADVGASGEEIVEVAEKFYAFLIAAPESQSDSNN